MKKLIVARQISSWSVLMALFLILCAPLSQAKIFQCKDKAGHVFYQDNECDASQQTISISDGAEPEAVESEVRVPHNTIIEDDKPGKLIYSDSRPLKPPYRIKVNEVRVITETDDTLVVDVIYTYEDPVPPDEIKLFVTPNHGYWSVPSLTVQRGTNVARASIGLSRSNMQRDHKNRSFTNTLRISFDHYKPKKFLGAVWTETVKYEKNWTLKR